MAKEVLGCTLVETGFIKGGVGLSVNTVPPGIVKGGGIYWPHEYGEEESLKSVEHAVCVVAEGPQRS